jgi:hypothetical protein
MSILLLRLRAVAAVSAVAPLAQAQLLTHRDLSYAMAKTIAETAIDSCGAKGYAVSAVVVDRDGEVIVAMRADNAGPHTMENARRKAYTARSFRTSTADYQTLRRQRPGGSPAGDLAQRHRHTGRATGQTRRRGHRRRRRLRLAWCLRAVRPGRARQSRRSAQMSRSGSEQT